MNQFKLVNEKGFKEKLFLNLKLNSNGNGFFIKYNFIYIF
jgi:hypothetical protein